MNIPKLTICIPTYNRAIYLTKCLNSILAQIDSLDMEVDIVISDNASTDNTEAVVNSYQKNYPNIRYSRNKKNVFDDNFFIAARLARTEYVWLFADDDEMESNAIKDVLEKLDDNYDILIANHSVWNKEMTRCIRHREYNQHSDMIINDHEQLLAAIGIKLQYISSLIFKKEILQHLPENNYATMHEYGFSLSYALYYGIMKTRGKAYFISKPLLRYRGDNSPLREINRWYKCFATGTTMLLNNLLKLGYSKISARSAKLQVLKEYIKRDIVMRRTSSEKTFHVFKLIAPYYKDHMYFWIVIVPLLIMPEIVIKFLKAAYSVIQAHSPAAIGE